MLHSGEDAMTTETGQQTLALWIVLMLLLALPWAFE
jgi:hypothetical protein